MLKGFGTFTNSKIASRKIISDSEGILDVDEPGNYVNELSLKSTTKAAINPTTIPGAAYGVSPAKGASGDKAMGYPWQGAGVASLDESHANKAERKLAY